MDYLKIYNQICDRAKEELDIRFDLKEIWNTSNRKFGAYFEGHHIIPRCLGGDGSSKDWYHNNIVALTAREHFLCHRLLTRIYPNNQKILSAFWGMCNQKRYYQHRYIPSSREYSEARELVSNALSNYSKLRLGELSNVYGKTWINKDDKNKRISAININSFLLAGWKIGRAPNSIKDRGGNSKFSKKIAQYSLDGKLIKIWDSISDASRELNIVKNNICKVCKGQYSQAKGFKFEYLSNTTFS